MRSIAILLEMICVRCTSVACRLISMILPRTSITTKVRDIFCILCLCVRHQCAVMYAPYIAANRDELINGFIDGKSIRDFRDDNNKKMTDVNLRERLEVYDNKLINTYTKSSGYVHFSSVALHASVQAMKDNYIDLLIGLPLSEEANIILLEAIEAFVHYIKLEIELNRTCCRVKKAGR